MESNLLTCTKVCSVHCCKYDICIVQLLYMCCTEVMTRSLVCAGRVRGYLVHMRWARVGGVCGVYDARMGLWHVCGEHARLWCVRDQVFGTHDEPLHVGPIRTRALCLVSRYTSALFARVRSGEPVYVRPIYLFAHVHVRSGDPLYVGPIRTRALLRAAVRRPYLFAHVHCGEPLYVSPIRTHGLWRAAVRQLYQFAPARSGEPLYVSPTCIHALYVVLIV
jgi:hypothetical protein